MAGNKREIWIFLRGLGREARHWGNFISKFEGDSSRRSVFCLDLPGSGVRFREQSPVSVEKIVDEVRSEFLKIKSENQNAEFYILAISLGGMVALDWLNRFDDFKGAVLINSSVAGVSPIYDRLRPSAALTLLAIARERDISKREAKALRLVSNRTDLLESGTSAWAEIARTQPMSVLNFSSQLLAASTFRFRDSKIHIPILVLSSEKDRLIRARASQMLATRLSAEQLTHPTAGHDLPFDDGEWVVKSVDNWISKI